MARNFQARSASAELGTNFYTYHNLVPFLNLSERRGTFGRTNIASLDMTLDQAGNPLLRFRDAGTLFGNRLFYNATLKTREQFLNEQVQETRWSAMLGYRTKTGTAMSLGYVGTGGSGSLGANFQTKNGARLNFLKSADVFSARYTDGPYEFSFSDFGEGVRFSAGFEITGKNIQELFGSVKVPGANMMLAMQSINTDFRETYNEVTKAVEKKFGQGGPDRQVFEWMLTMRSEQLSTAIQQMEEGQFRVDRIFEFFEGQVPTEEFWVEFKNAFDALIDEYKGSVPPQEFWDKFEVALDALLLKFKESVPSPEFWTKFEDALKLLLDDFKGSVPDDEFWTKFEDALTLLLEDYKNSVPFTRVLGPV